MRLQWPQKGCVTGAMMPISPTPSSKVKRRAVSPAALAGSANERTPAIQPLHDFIQRNDDVRRPEPIFFERHELDEADDHALLRENSAKGIDLVFVEAAQKDAVNFHRPEARSLRGAHPGEHLLKAAGNARDAREGFGIDGVHAHGNAGKARIAQRLRQAGKQMAVGGDGEIERRPSLADSGDPAWPKRVLRLRVSLTSRADLCVGVARRQ